MGDRWVSVYTVSRTRCTVPRGRPVEVGEAVLVGREQRLSIGTDPPDKEVSRRALIVTPTETGWRIWILNRNGAVIHPWGQAPLRAGDTTTLSWPLVGVRVLGRQSVQHWVLLEAEAQTRDDEPAARSEPEPRPVAKGRPLAAMQLQALRALFADCLRWPPSFPAEPRQLQQVANRLGVGIGGLQERLREARKRAADLGLRRAVAITDPEYLFELVRDGFLPAPTARPFRREI